MFLFWICFWKGALLAISLPSHLPSSSSEEESTSIASCFTPSLSTTHTSFPTTSRPIPLQLPFHPPIPFLAQPHQNCHTRSHTPARTLAPRARPCPPPVRRAVSVSAMSAATVLCGDGGWGRAGGCVTAGRGQGAGLGRGKRRRERVATRGVRVRTDEDRSSVRAWRFTRCFSACDAEAVEVVGAEL